jgi:hypothetical protein
VKNPEISFEFPINFLPAQTYTSQPGLPEQRPQKVAKHRRPAARPPNHLEEVQRGTLPPLSPSALDPESLPPSGPVIPFLSGTADRAVVGWHAAEADRRAGRYDAIVVAAVVASTGDPGAPTWCPTLFFGPMQIVMAVWVWFYRLFVNWQKRRRRSRCFYSVSKPRIEVGVASNFRIGQIQVELQEGDLVNLVRRETVN